MYMHVSRLQKVAKVHAQLSTRETRGK